MRAVLAIGVLLAVALQGVAEHGCTAWTTTSPSVACIEGVGDLAGRVYVDDDCCQLCTYSIWIYEESNGIAGLQRGDEVLDDTCHGLIESDTVIF